MTTETKHTPGPWNVEKYCVWAGDKYVAATQTGIDEEEQAANARLIAAAPDMLAVCHAVAALNEGQGRLNLCEVAGMARNVLRPS